MREGWEGETDRQTDVEAQEIPDGRHVLRETKTPHAVLSVHSKRGAGPGAQSIQRPRRVPAFAGVGGWWQPVLTWLIMSSFLSLLV